MGLRLLVIIALVFSVQTAWADSLAKRINSQFWWCMVKPWDGSEWNIPSKFGECRGTSYKVLFEASGVSDQLNEHSWMPVKGKATVSDYFILVQFMVDDAMLNFFKTKFLGSNARLPIGLEIDVAPLDNDVFRESGNVKGIGSSDDWNNAGLFLDTSVFDSHPSYGAVIRNPHKLKSDTPYAVVFHTKDVPLDAPWQGPKLIQQSGKVRLYFQVSIDYLRAERMIAAYDLGDHELMGFSGDGVGKAFQYYVVETDAFERMEIPPDDAICWYGKSGDSIGCKDGNPIHDDIAEDIANSNGAVSQNLLNGGEAISSDGTATIPAVGPGGASSVTDPITPGFPDFMVSKVWTEDRHRKEKTDFAPGERIRMNAEFRNIGQGNPAKNKKIEAHFYLSDGYKEDAHSDWKRVGTGYIKSANLKKGRTKTEMAEMNAPGDPGVYNIVACVDHIRDDHNEGGAIAEEHESNNCSTEAVFVVSVPNILPTGSVDIVNCTAVQGWAADQNTQNPLEIHIYRGDVNGDNQEFIDGLTANIYREDVGSHGFSWTVPEALKTGAAHTLFLYAINVPIGDNPRILQNQNPKPIPILCAAPVNGLYPVYRAYSTLTRSHFYTISESDKDGLYSIGWKMEGVAFRAHSRQEAGTTPVYRLYRTGRGHFFTTSQTERDTLTDFIYEGIAFYAYSSQLSGTVPVYRLYHPNKRNHFYTASESERDNAIATMGYRYEGIAWYAGSPG